MTNGEAERSASNKWQFSCDVLIKELGLVVFPSIHHYYYSSSPTHYWNMIYTHYIEYTKIKMTSFVVCSQSHRIPRERESDNTFLCGSIIDRAWFLNTQEEEPIEKNRATAPLGEKRDGSWERHYIWAQREFSRTAGDSMVGWREISDGSGTGEIQVWSLLG